MHFISLAEVRHGLHGLTLIQSVKFREIRVSRERQGNQVRGPVKFFEESAPSPCPIPVLKQMKA